jgi:tritrans,polycis-undecaprenyl-diphosphate synthase [geranylgeranyl-diphosphate specific]
VFIIKPNHIGIIMDGNRRFAKSLKLNPWKGHEYGEKKLFALLEWCRDLDIKEVTVYAFSMQNLNRPKKEFDYLMKLFVGASKKVLSDPEFLKSNVKIRVLGDLSLFPDEVRDGFSELIEKTKDNDSYFFNIAFGYGGREEILRAVKNIASDVKSGVLNPEDIDESVFEDNLYLSSTPDLIIRTGGDFRTSNFLPWQSIYSEWFFLDKKWPEFSREDLLKCINDFSARERRFGK